MRVSGISYRKAVTFLAVPYAPMEISQVAHQAGGWACQQAYLQQTLSITAFAFVSTEATSLGLPWSLTCYHTDPDMPVHKHSVHIYRVIKKCLYT
jgi:hypothetical protein